MGVLEELKQQAEKAKAEREKQEQSERGQRKALERRLIARIDELYGYFKEFQQQLNVVNPEVALDFYITDVCTLKNLRQQNYRITTDGSGELRRFTLHYDCVGKGIKEVKFPSLVLAEQKKDRLQRCNLRFKLKQYSPSHHSMLIESFVPVSFRFKVDVDRAAIRLKVRNKPMPGSSNYTYDADEINAEFMDELAKYILDKPNRFDELSGNTIPEDTLTRIRAQLKMEKERNAGATSTFRAKLAGPLFGKKA